MFNAADLNQFIGTTQYYLDGITRKKYTDGVHHVEQNGAGWLISDALIVLAMVEGVRGQPFVHIKATPETETERARVTYDDGNDNVLHKQEYMTSDLPCEVRMYFTSGVLMLASEY